MSCLGLLELLGLAWATWAYEWDFNSRTDVFSLHLLTLLDPRGILWSPCELLWTMVDFCALVTLVGLLL